MQETTVTIEFTGYTDRDLKTLEGQFKHIHAVGTSLVEPAHTTAPALLAIGIDRDREDAREAALRVAQALYTFLHQHAGITSTTTASLVTIEGERDDLAPLSVEEIHTILFAAIQGE